MLAREAILSQKCPKTPENRSPPLTWQGLQPFHPRHARYGERVDDPIHALRIFLITSVFVAWVVAFVLWWLLKRHWNGKFDRLGESTPEEMLAELENEYVPRRHTVIRTQTEYLPYVFECIRENIERGFDDPQVQSLLQRIDLHRPDEERRAVFVIDVEGRHSDLSFRWRRDAHDRIELHVQAAPSVIEALKAQKKRIPRAAVQ